MDHIEIKGYKSIKEAKIVLRPVNILIGANGSGKSNFISFFEFLNKVYEQNLKEYVAKSGGADKILFQGSKITKDISTYISFDENINAYSFTLNNADNKFIFVKEDFWHNSSSWDTSQFGSEATIKSFDNYNSSYVKKHLRSFKKYHFHDTGKNSPFGLMSNVQNDTYFLYEDGRNLAALLYGIQRADQIVYNLIIKTIQSVAPYFSDFYFHPNSEGFISLQWQDKYCSTIYGASDLSDGTARFIALTTLFMQPSLPDNIIIDEPELGLHPFAISKLAGMIQSASVKGTQVIIATQSSDLVNHFEPEDILTVDQVNGETVFNRLREDELSLWLEDYSIGDLWQRNILEGGQP